MRIARRTPRVVFVGVLLGSLGTILPEADPAGATNASPGPLPSGSLSPWRHPSRGSGSVPASPAPATPQPAATSAAPAPGGYLSRQGTKLVLDGAQYRVVGLNAYELATDWGYNFGCGGELDDRTLDNFFATLPPRSLVRMWGFQGSMATNPTTHQRDWTGLDRVVAAAQRHGQMLVVSLGNQPGSCDDGHWKDRAWYSGGYRNVYPGDGSSVATVSYWDWVHEIVSRYRDSTAIGMWEPINEPEASECAAGYAMDDCYHHILCPNSASATAALTAFFNTVGTEIKALDSNHLVESGALAQGQCGWTGTGYSAVQASAGIDVVSYHDYDASSAMPAGVTIGIDTARSLAKPMIVGELGISAADGTTQCRSLSSRLDLARAKADTALSRGASGVFLWNSVADPPSRSCSYDIAAGDPTLTIVGPRAG